MEINNLVTRIKQLHSDISQQEATGDAITDAKIEGYCFGVNKVLEIIKEEKEYLRLQQQLARKEDRLKQGPDAALDQLTGQTPDAATTTNNKANVTPFLRPESTDHDAETTAEKQAV